MAYRIESGRLDRAERMAGGGIRVPATLGRSGVLVYRKPDGSEWREYRPPAEAFAAESLSSARGAPVTDLHPQTGKVTTDNYTRVSRGHAGDDARQDGDHLLASLCILDGDLIRKIDAGERSEVSAGYDTDLDYTPGVTPDGQPYDAIQRNIIYNHFAVIPKGSGRAGPTVGLRLDSNLDVDFAATDAAEAGSKDMKITLRFDGVDYQIDVDETAAKTLPAALEKERSEAAKARKDCEDLRIRADALEKERDVLKGRTDALEGEAKKLADPATVAALVRARVELERKAAALDPDLRCDGLTDRELMAKASGFEASSDHSDDYVRSRFDALVERSERADGSLRMARVAASSAGGQQISEAEAARRALIERNRNAWKQEGI